MDSPESINQIKIMYDDIKSGKYDTPSPSCLGQIITIAGLNGTNLSIAKGRPNWESYTGNMETLRVAIQPILTAWEEYCVQNGLNQEVGITSGYRPKLTNGNSNSAHLVGLAVD